MKMKKETFIPIQTDCEFRVECEYFKTTKFKSGPFIDGENRFMIAHTIHKYERPGMPYESDDPRSRPYGCNEGWAVSFSVINPEGIVDNKATKDMYDRLMESMRLVDPMESDLFGISIYHYKVKGIIYLSEDDRGDERNKIWPLVTMLDTLSVHNELPAYKYMNAWKVIRETLILSYKLYTVDIRICKGIKEPLAR